MYRFGELDKPLNFHGDSEIDTSPLTNCPTLGVANEVREACRSGTDAHTAAARTLKAEFGANGGVAAKRYHKGARALLHHQVEYAPCKTLTPEEYEKLK